MKRLLIVKNMTASLCTITMVTSVLFAIGSMPMGGYAKSRTDVREPCEVLPGRIVDGYSGFPFNLKYSTRHKRALFLLFKLPQAVGLNATCTVTDEHSGKVVNRSNFAPFRNPFSNPMVVAYATQGATSTSNFTIKCSLPVNTSSTAQGRQTFCVMEKVTIAWINKSSENCTGVSVHPGLIMKEPTRQALFYLRCELPDTLKLSDMVTPQWFQYDEGECKNEFVGGAVVSRSHQLLFKKVDFKDAGLYMCVATFKGRKILISKFDVCIKNPKFRNEDMALICNDGKSAIDGTVNITCSIHLSIGKLDPGYFIWHKISEDSTEEICNKSHIPVKSKFRCSEVSSLRGEGCFRSKPSEAAASDMRTITLTIKNAGESDFGDYQLEYYPTPDNKLVSSVKVTRDMSEKRNQQISEIAIAVGVCAVIITLLLAILAMKIEILWFVKKYYGKPVKGESAVYTASFLYTYNSEKHNVESVQSIQVLVESVEAVVESIGGSVYDEHREVPQDQCDTVNIMDMHQKCLRVIIFLSPEFVKDHWSRYATYTALEAEIREGKKIIFISMPGTKKAIKQIEHDSRRTLEIAMKRNITIHWNGKIPLARRFRMYLEYALPKLENV